MIEYREMNKTEQWKFVPDGKMEIPFLLETLNSEMEFFIAITSKNENS